MFGQDFEVRTPAAFNVDNNGAALYQIPIKVVDGVNGMQPNLSVSYNSSAGNGPLGIGFQLNGLSEIQRVQPNYVTDGMNDAIDFDNNDRFALDGMRLMRINGTKDGGNGVSYRKEIDDFTLVTSYGTAGNGPQRFLIKYGDGRIAEFGYTADSRVEAPGKSDVVRWRINRLRDPFGNYMDFEYYENNFSRESIIKKISYGGHLHTGGGHFASVTFDRVGRPTDERIPTWSGGARQVMNHRITAIRCLYYNAQEHRYTFNYANSGAIRTSRITQMQECGTAGACHPPITFSWGNMQEDGRFFIRGGFPMSGYNLSANNYKWLNGDFNGDGKTDMVHIKSSGKLSVWMSDGDGTFTVHGNWPATSYNFSYPNNTYNIKVGDFDGDGLDDLVHFRSPTALKVFLSKGNGTFAYTPTFTFGSGGTDANNHYNYRLGDFNGDGRMDLIQFRTQNRARTLISHGDGSFGLHNSFPEHPNYDISKNNYNFRVADFNGDGATDLVYLRANNEVRAFLSDSDGTFTIAAPQYFSSYQVGANNYNYQAGDFNGDGLADLIHFYNSNMVRVWLSNGDGKFTVRGAFPNNNYNVSANGYKFHLGDFNGDGLTDLFHLVNSTVGHTWYSKGNGTFIIKAAFPNTGYNLS
ncbi:MAG: FG-GAP-like repeat-containing protein, partial [Bacteroidota bacterium]